MLPYVHDFQMVGIDQLHTALWLPFFLGQPFGHLPDAPVFLEGSRRIARFGRIDGASQARTFVTIALPLVRAGL
jgi:ABC-type glycerol-3-phosphate transport system permease component